MGDFVLFSTYIVQLYAPLNFLGTYYRMIQQSFIDMENMLELMCEESEVKDAQGCADMCLVDGEIVFDDVSFHYVPEKPILKNISFTVAAGMYGQSVVLREGFRLNEGSQNSYTQSWTPFANYCSLLCSVWHGAHACTYVIIRSQNVNLLCNHL